MLFYGDVELSNTKATLQQYNVPAEATIHIERRQMSIDDYDILTADTDEQGFKGNTHTKKERKKEGKGKKEKVNKKE